MIRIKLPIAWAAAAASLLLLALLLFTANHNFIIIKSGQVTSRSVESPRGSPISSANFNCKSTKDPIILLVDASSSVNDSARTYFRSYQACPYSCCYTQDWAEFIDVADLVAFPTFALPFNTAFQDLNQSAILTWQESKEEQLWLAVTVSSPYDYRTRGKQIDGAFHLIGNYRPDADIRFPYGKIEKINKNPARTEGFVHTWQHQNVFVEPPSSMTKPRRASEAPRQKKLVAAVVMQCESGSRKELLLQSLQKYVAIDIYGYCGPFQCPDEAFCLDHVAANYKFVLAFEFSLCIDYVTEQLWSALARNTLPVSYSWINNTSTLPPHSYINALDFRSVKQLAQYLVYLDKHEDEYLKYFQWKQEYRVVDGGDGLCSTCEKLWHFRKSKTSSVGKKFMRHDSVLGWMNTLPQNVKSNGKGYKMAEFRVGNDQISTNKTCVDPVDHKVLMNWIRDVRP